MKVKIFTFDLGDWRNKPEEEINKFLEENHLTFNSSRILQSQSTDSMDRMIVTITIFYE